jgi:hypothetical protein
MLSQQTAAKDLQYICQKLTEKISDGNRSLQDLSSTVRSEVSGIVWKHLAVASATFAVMLLLLSIVLWLWLDPTIQASKNGHTYLVFLLK